MGSCWRRRKTFNCAFFVAFVVVAAVRTVATAATAAAVTAAAADAAAGCCYCCWLLLLLLQFLLFLFFHGWTFFFAMEFSGAIVTAIDATTTNFFTHHTPTFKNGESMFLKQFLSAPQTKHMGASGADQNFTPQITTTVARGTVRWWSFHRHASFVHVLARCQ